jgi:hypothetical protein
MSRLWRDYHPSEILDVCSIYDSGFLGILALHLKHSCQPLLVFTSTSCLDIRSSSPFHRFTVSPFRAPYLAAHFFWARTFHAGGTDHPCQDASFAHLAIKDKGTAGVRKRDDGREG